MTRFLGLFTLLLSLLISTTNTAQTVTIGTETNLGSDITGSLPINPYAGFSYSQTIYLAEDIDASGYITAIKYHFNGTSLANSREIKIYMGLTTKQSFGSDNRSWFAPSALTLVFDGIVDSVHGDTWLRIPLTTPFEYGEDYNLVVAVDENNPSYDGENDKFYYTNVPDTEGARSLFFISDDDNIDPEAGKPSGFLANAYANIQLEGMAFNCKKPKTPSVFDIIGATATASWTAPTTGPTVTNYTWKVVKAGQSIDSAAISTGNVTNTTATITGLARGLSYDFYVQTTCIDHNVDRWVGPISFTAGCAPTTNFPFIEDFEATTGGAFASCWTEIDTSEFGPHWHTETGEGNNSNRVAVVEASSYHDTWLILPQTTLNGNQRLRYAARIGDALQKAVKYDIRLSTTGKQPDDFTIAVTDTMSVNFEQYRDTSHSLAAYSGNVYIAIHTTLANIEYFNKLFIDDIVVENIPTCLEPTKLVTADVTADSATLSWTSEGNTTGQWQIYYGYTFFLNPPYSRDSLLGQMIMTNSNNFVLRGLEQYADYTWWVRRVCGVGDTSRWSNPTGFRTPPACGTPTNITFVTDSTTTRFHWTTNKRPQSWEIYYGIADTTVHPEDFWRRNGTTRLATDTSFTLTHLKYPKLYSVWVKSLCDTLVGDSEWSEKATFQSYEKNDFCTAAILIPVAANATAALTNPTPLRVGGEGAADGVFGSDAQGYQYAKDTWYKFVAPNNNQRIVIRTTSDNDQSKWFVALYDSCNGQPIKWAFENLSPNSQSNIALCPYEYTPNKTYYLRVLPFWLGSNLPNNLVVYADTTACPAVPSNDVCANATLFSRVDTATSSTFLATKQTNDRPKCEAPNANLYDVWFKFSSGSGANRLLNTVVVFDNTTSQGDYSMTIYKGTCGQLKEVEPRASGDCIYTFNGLEQRTIYLDGLEENQDYYLRVWSTIEHQQGNFRIFLGESLVRDSAYVFPNFSASDCDTAKTVTIDAMNNNRWVPIMKSGDIVAEIKANGQDLGEVKTAFYSQYDTVRKHDGRPYLGRNLRLSASKPPRMPIQMRFYVAGAEWDSFRVNDPSINDTTFRVVRMVGDSSCKIDVDPTGFTLTRMNDAKLKKLDEDYCIEYTTSLLGHFFVTTIPQTTITYPNAHICPSESSQKDSLVGATGGTYTALPVGLTINAATGTVTPPTSKAGLYTVSYAIPDLYGGGVATTTIKIDTATQITVQPPTRRVLTVGSPITLSVGGVGENLTYQWRKDSVNIPNATNKTLTIASASMADTGLYSVVLTGACGSVTSINTVVSNDNGVIVSAKVFLQGAFNTTTGLMNDNLRTLNLLPTVEPYSNLLTFTHVKGNKNATATPSVLAAFDNTAVVDWVFLELRAATDPSVIVATQSVLVRRDGVIVDAEGNAAVYFGDVPQGNYYVSIRHRNHFGIRTANALNFIKGVPTAFDFTTPTAAIYVNPSITTNPPTKTITVSGVDYRTLWTGDINQDGFIKYNGSKNDRSVVLIKVGGVLTNTSSGYLLEDVNLNGIVKYNGSLNDRSVLLINVGGVLTNVLKQHL